MSNKQTCRLVNGQVQLIKQAEQPKIKYEPSSHPSELHKKPLNLDWNPLMRPRGGLEVGQMNWVIGLPQEKGQG